VGRRGRWAAGALAVGLLAAGHVVDAATSAERWTVDVAWPEGDWQSCLDHPAVESGVVAPSLPTAGASVTLAAHAPRAAADEIAHCLRAGGNHVEVAHRRT